MAGQALEVSLQELELAPQDAILLGSPNTYTPTPAA